MKKAIIVLGLAVLLAIPVLSFAGNVVNTKLPISGTTFNSCTGELVDFTGELQIIVNSSTNANGTVHFILKESAHFTGVGETSGASYVANATFSDKVIDAICPFSQTITDYLRFIGKGSVPNWRVREDVSFNLDAACTPTFTATLSDACK
jgi:hypothetical protein